MKQPGESWKQIILIIADYQQVTLFHWKKMYMAFYEHSMT